MAAPLWRPAGTRFEPGPAHHHPPRPALFNQAQIAAIEEHHQLEEELALYRARHGLLGFTCYTKPDYQVNWHHRVIARHLNLVAQGQLKRLIICQPPRTGKSELVSTRLPAFLFGVNPKTQIIAASYNATLAAKMNRTVQRVIDSPEYARVFPETQLNGSNVRSTAQGSWLRNSDEFEVVGHGGFYRSAGVGGSATGYGMTVGIIDDPVKNREEANSRVYQERVWDWYTSTFYSRLEKEGAIIVCATRWSEGDLIGRLLAQAAADPEADQWTLLTFPALCEKGKHPDDPRQLDEPLWPEKYSLARMAKMKKAIGSRDWASLYQQRPAPAGGSVVKDVWWRYYDKLPQGLTDYTLSVDLTFDNKGDFACYQVWAAKGADRYLLDMVLRRETFTEQLHTFAQMCAKHPQVRVKLVEKAANGAALISTLQSKIPGIIPVVPVGSKENRAEAVAPQIEAGNVYLPTPAQAPWVGEFVSQWSYFPNGAHDDAVDSASMALRRMERRVALGGGSPVGIGKESHWTQGAAAPPTRPGRPRL